MKYWLTLLLFVVAMTVVVYCSRAASIQLDVKNGSEVAIELLVVRLPSGTILRTRDLAPDAARSFILRPKKAGGLLLRWGFVGNPNTYEDFRSFVDPRRSASLHYLIRDAGIEPVITEHGG